MYGRFHFGRKLHFEGRGSPMEANKGYDMQERQGRKAYAHYQKKMKKKRLQIDEHNSKKEMYLRV